LIIFSDNDNNERYRGTSGYRVGDGTGSECIVTASHVIAEEVCDFNIDGHFTYQEIENLGEIEDHWHDADVALTDASRNYGTSIKNKIYEPDGTVRTIDGRASSGELDNRAADPFDGYRKIGTTTGKTTGGIGKTGLSTQDCFGYGGEGVRGDAISGPGDSGGPAYSVENGDAYMLYRVTKGQNMDCGFDTCAGDEGLACKTIGTAAYYVTDTLGYNIMT